TRSDRDWSSDVCSSDLGMLAGELGDHERATTLLEQCLAMWRELDDRDGMAAALGGLGRVAYAQGDYDRAAMLHCESLALFRDLEIGRASGRENGGGTSG